MQDDKIVNSSTENPLKNENIDNVLKDLPKEKREVIYSAFYAIERSYSGPLPPPEDFAKYEQNLPGSMDRILKLTEKQVEHRIEIERSNVKLDGRGQIIGALLVALFGVLSFGLAMFDHENVALAMGVTTVISVAVIFVLKKMPIGNNKKTS